MAPEHEIVEGDTSAVRQDLRDEQVNADPDQRGVQAKSECCVDHADSIVADQQREPIEEPGDPGADESLADGRFARN